MSTVKHPRALYVLFFTEMWERFGYYLMVGIFFLYLVDPSSHGGKGFDNKMAADLVGSYIALVYLTPFIGGLIADRYIGYRRAIIIGGTLMACGYIGLAVPGDTAMYISLLCIIIGNGFFKPNISTLLGNIYSTDELKPQKDMAYNIFYMGINIGAFFCNFVAAYLRNTYGWGYAFAAAGVGMLIGLGWFISGMKHVKSGDVVKPVQKEDMKISTMFTTVFGPAILTGILGWFMSTMIGHPLFGTKSNDAFLFACVPIIIFYVGQYFRANKEDKRGLGALLSFFLVSIVFWVIYNQNSTALTIWAESYTDRKMPEMLMPIAEPIGLLQDIKNDSTTQPVLDEHLIQKSVPKGATSSFDSAMRVDEKQKTDTVYILHYADAGGARLGSGEYHGTKGRAKALAYKSDFDSASAGLKKGVGLVMLDIDPYFKNLDKEKMPKPGETAHLISTEEYQSVNPAFIVILTPIVLGLFNILRRKKKEPTTPGKIGIGMIVAGLSSLVMIFCIMGTDIYHGKTNMLWLTSTYAVFTIGELLISPIGLSMVSKLAPARTTAVMMGGWFLVNSIAGKISGLMASYWDDITDKKMYFMILFIAALVSAGIIFMMVRWLNAVVREKTGGR